jgi:acyl-CoA thioesterase II
LSPTPEPVVSELIELLSLERLEDNLFRGQSRDIGTKYVFGGQVLGQALSAAQATVDRGRGAHSLHAYFLRAGDIEHPIVYDVDRTRDGSSFSVRRVTAIQHGKTILEMIASFHRPEPGADWQPPAVPAIEFDDSVPKIAGLEFAERFDIRTTAGDESVFAVPPFWIRTRDLIEDDPLIRACTLTFMSDFGPVPVARPPGTSLNAEGAYAASLDHAVWFHRPFRPDQWHRYEVRSLNNSDARGLVVGSLYDGSGALVASTSQEALWRF